jgi:WD40 repeat protein
MRLTHENVTCVQWYPNSINVITSSGKDGNLKVWDVGRRCVSVEIKPSPSRLVRITQHHQSLVSRIPVVAGLFSNTLRCNKLLFPSA